MKLAALFSGGKDSAYAIYKAMKEHEIICLITIKSENLDSYMFHTPAINLTSMQAEAIDIPLITVSTKGRKEEELKDLKKAIQKSIKLYNIEGVVTGAVESVYQAERIQQICKELDIWCFNPLWQKNQITLLKELLENNFNIMITGVAAFPFDNSWLGKIIDKNTINDLAELQRKYKTNPAGEGGEYETLTLEAPFFKKKLQIKKYDTLYDNHAGRIIIKEAALR